MFKVGDKFTSLEEFESKLREYEKSTIVNYWKRDCRTLESHANKFPESIAASADEKLRYYFIKLACSFGGRHFISKSNKRKQHSDEKTDCPACVLVKLSDCGKYLVVVQVNEQHNHSLTECVEIDEEENNEGENNFISLKELSTKESDFTQTTKALREVYKYDVNILCDEEDNILCLYCQDPEMKTVFEAYPELIFIDGTYCLNKNGPCIYTILGEDAEGNGVVFATGFLLNENEEILDWFINEFKEYNTSCKEVKVVVTDKDAPINPVLLKNFPEASLEIALFNTLNKFKREISKEFILNESEVRHVLDLFEEIVLSSSEEAFEEGCEKFLSSVPENIAGYYEKTWHPIRDLWVLYLTSNYRFSINDTSNRLEVVNQKIKSIIINFTNFKDFTQQFIEGVKAVRADCISEHFKKTTTKIIPDLKQYKMNLTNYAFLKTQDQLAQVKKLNSLQVVSKEKLLLSGPEGSFEVTKNTCSCLFRITMNLPCCHLFKFRMYNKLPLYSDDLYTKRWTCKYFQSHYPFFTPEEKVEDRLSECSNEEEASINDEKFKLMYDECVKLTDICCDLPDDAFNKRVEFLHGLIKKWTNFEDDEEDHEIFQDDGGDASPSEYLLEVAEDEQEEVMDDDEEEEEEDNDSDSDYEVNGGSTKRKKIN